jgi:UDP-glucose 4-epimerase
VCAEVAAVEVEVTVGPRRPGDPAVLVASADKARDELGWTPKRGDLAQIVADAWRWHTREKT